jgi:peptidoglycan/xylan/chitin deacetylase (PgdA/CDA1 family)
MTANETNPDSGEVAQGTSRRSFIAAGTMAVGAITLAQSSSPANAQAGKSAARGTFWPNGARLAIAVSMVVETGADPDPTVNGPDGKKYPDLYAATAVQYASREAIPRMLDMFDRRRIKMTSMICGQSCERHPDLAKQIAQRGHECASHGRSHDIQYTLSREAERDFIRDSADMIAKATGQRPIGYNCRGQLRSANTLSLLQELGFVYHIDDISRDEPFVETVNGKPFAVVPYTQHLGDIGYFSNRGFAAPFLQELKDEFDALYAEAERKRRMMVVTIHDSIARASRVRAFEEFFTYAQKQKGVWFARADALARWALESPDSIKEKTAT